MRLSIEDIKVNVSNAMKWKNGVLQIDILKVHVPVCVHEKKRKIKKKKREILVVQTSFTMVILFAMNPYHVSVKKGHF